MAIASFHLLFRRPFLLLNNGSIRRLHNLWHKKCQDSQKANLTFVHNMQIRFYQALSYFAVRVPIQNKHHLKAHCGGFDWLIVVLKSLTKDMASEQLPSFYALGSYFVSRIKALRSLSPS